MATPITRNLGDEDNLSSPDPLNDTVSSALYPSSRRVTRSQRSQRLFSVGGPGTSPRKQMFELEVGDNRAPQRLLVTVEAEDEYENVGRRLFNAQTPSLRRGATTTTIPLGGDKRVTAVKTPARRGRPPKNATPGPSGTTTTSRKRAATPKKTPRPARRPKIGDSDDLTSELTGIQGTPKSIMRRTTRGSSRQPRDSSADPALSTTVTTRRRGRPRKVDFNPDETIHTIEDDYQGVAPSDDMLAAGMEDMAVDDATPAREQTTEKLPDSEQDIWMATIDDEATPRPTTQTNTTLPHSPSPAYPQKSPTPSDQFLSEDGNEPAYDNYEFGPGPASDISSLIDGSNGNNSGGSRDRELDTVAQGEDFSMIFANSIPSLRGNMSVQASGPEDFGDETSLIINRTLESLRQSGALRPDDEEDEVAEVPSEPAAEAEEIDHDATRHTEASPSNNIEALMDSLVDTSTDFHHETIPDITGEVNVESIVDISAVQHSPVDLPSLPTPRLQVPATEAPDSTPSKTWTRSSPRRKSIPLGRKLLESKARQMDDSFSSVPSRILAAATPKKRGSSRQSSASRRSSMAKEDVSVAYEDDFSEFPEEILEAATPGRTLQRVDVTQDDEEAEAEPNDDDKIEEQDDDRMEDQDDTVEAARFRPSPTKSASNASVSFTRSDSGRMPTPDDTPSPNDVPVPESDNKTIDAPLTSPLAEQPQVSGETSRMRSRTRSSSSVAERSRLSQQMHSFVDEQSQLPEQQSPSPMAEHSYMPEQRSSSPVGETTYMPDQRSSSPVGEQTYLPDQRSSSPVAEQSHLPERNPSPIDERSHLSERSPSPAHERSHLPEKTALPVQEQSYLPARRSSPPVRAESRLPERSASPVHEQSRLRERSSSHIAERSHMSEARNEVRNEHRSSSLPVGDLTANLPIATSEYITPVAPASSPIPTPDVHLLAPRAPSPDNGMRPTLSPIVRAGRALQSVTSDASSPPRQNSLGSPFRPTTSSSQPQPQSASKSRNSWTQPLSNLIQAGAQFFQSPTRHVAQPSAPHSAGQPPYEDPFGAENNHVGQPSFMEALTKSIRFSSPSRQPEAPASLSGSLRAAPADEVDEMSWMQEEPAPREQHFAPSRSANSSMDVIGNSFGSQQPSFEQPSLRRVSFGRSVQKPAFESQGLEDGDETEVEEEQEEDPEVEEEHPVEEEDEEDIWAVEASRPASQSSRQEVSGKQSIASIPARRTAVPSPWKRRGDSPQKQPIFTPGASQRRQSIIDEAEAEDFSMLSQQRSRQKQIPHKAFQIAQQSSAKKDLSAFFSSPALLPGTEGVQSILDAKKRENAFASRNLAQPAEKPSAGLETNSMFPSIPQKAFNPSASGRSDLFSPAKSSAIKPSAHKPVQDTRRELFSFSRSRGDARQPSEIPDSQPPMSDEISFPSVPQKKNFTPRSGQKTNNLFSKSSAPVPSLTPVRMQLTRADIKKWQEDSASAIAEDSPEASRRALRPLPDRNLSPTKSCLRSPLKPRTPGRVVEFTSSVLSPLAQAQARAERRISFSSNGSSVAAQQQPQQQQQRNAPIPEEDKENDLSEDTEEMDISMADAPETSPPKTAPALADTATSTRLSQTMWSRDHWLLLAELVQLRRQGPFNFQWPAGFQRKSGWLLGRPVISHGTSLAMDQWHLDVVDAFKVEVGGWDEETLAKRVFSLIVGEKLRNEGRAPQGPSVKFV